METKLATLAAVGLLLSGCATARPPVQMIRYSKPGGTQEQFMKDRYECLQESQQRVSGAAVDAYGGAANSQVVTKCGLWVSCMGARGYTVDPTGNLSAPPGMVVLCRR
jgi:hypothetical protein